MLLIVTFIKNPIDAVKNYDLFTTAKSSRRAKFAMHEKSPAA